MPAEPIRVLHTPTTVGGHPQGLAEAERALGLASRVVALEPPPFGLRADSVLFEAGQGRAAREVRRWRFLTRVLRDFDVFHFNFGSSVLPRYYPRAATGRRGLAASLYGAYAKLVELRDLPLLKRRGKAVVVTYQGDDARQADQILKRLAGTLEQEQLQSYYLPEVDRRKRTAIATFDRYADAIYALNPDLLQVLPNRAEFLAYASVDPADWRPTRTPRTSGRAVVAHAPTDRRAKGTRFVIAAVEALRARGVDVELHLIEGASHEEARAAYLQADLFVDQLVLGWYGTTAVELMALGKPVVAHVHNEDLSRIPAQMQADLPVIRATATTLADVLEEWLTRRRPELGEVGRRGRSYVQRWHDPRAVAAQTKARYEEILERTSPRR